MMDDAMGAREDQELTEGPVSAIPCLGEGKGAG